MAELFNLTRMNGPELPSAFAVLVAEGAAEGLRIPARVAADWAAGFRFDRAGEVLLAGWRGPVLAGIGGMTHDPDWPGALRLRRFFVRQPFRRQGLARQLALALLAGIAPGRVVTVHAGTPDAPAFWAAMGFLPDPGRGLHVLPARHLLPGGNTGALMAR